MRRYATLAGLLLSLGALVWFGFLHDAGERTSQVAGSPGADEDSKAARLGGRVAPSRPGPSAANDAIAAEEARGRGRLEVLVVRADDESTVAGASVTWRHADDGSVAQATTDSDGSARWADLAAGLGHVVVRAEGFGRVKELALATRDGEREELLQVVLHPALTLQGVAVAAIDGRPLAGALARLVSIEPPVMSKDPCYAVREEVDRTTTDAHGAFRFEGCSRWCGDEMLAVVVTARGHAPARKLVLTPDPLLEPGGTRIAVPPAGRVEGVLRGPDGEGVPGVVVAAPAHLESLLRHGEHVHVLPNGHPLWAEDLRPEGLVDLYAAQRVSAGPDGRFLFEGLPLRTRVVLQGRSEDGRPTPPSTPLRVERETAPVSLTFELPGRLIVSVKNADGTPHEGAHVVWRRYVSGTHFHATREEREVDSNAEGVAVFDRLTPGPFEVRAWDKGFRVVTQRGAVEPGGTVSRELVTWPEADRREPDPTPAPPAGGDPWAPSDATEPSADARQVVVRAALLQPEGDSLPRGYVLGYDGEGSSGSTHGTWTTDRGRRLTVDLEFDGGAPVTVTARVAGYLPVAWSVPSDATGLVLLEERTLDPGLTVSGRVRDADGRPIAGARVSLGTPGADSVWLGVGEVVRESVTAPDGRFVVASLPLGPLEWVVRTPWFTHEEHVHVRAAMPPLEASLPARTLIHCRIVDADGVPVARMPVTVRSTDDAVPGRRGWRGLSDSGGQARATVIAGRWRVEVRLSSEWGDPSGVASSEDVDLTAGGETTVVLVVEREE